MTDEAPKVEAPKTYKAPPVTKAAGALGQPAASREEAHAVAAQIMGAASRAPDHVAHRDAPRVKEQLALRTFSYGGREIDRGQVFRLQGLVNDKRMYDLRYFVDFDAETTTYECPKCGERFTAAAFRDGHVKGRHLQKRFVPPPPPIRESDESMDSYQNRLDEWAKAAGAAADAADDRRDRMENEVAPLDLTKTAASRGA